MFNPLKSLQDLTSLQQQAQQMRNALQQEEVEAEGQGVRVVLSGDQQVKDVIVDGVSEKRIVDVINDAIKKTQKLAAQKLLEMSKQQ